MRVIKLIRTSLLVFILIIMILMVTRIDDWVLQSITILMLLIIVMIVVVLSLEVKIKALFGEDDDILREGIADVDGILIPNNTIAYILVLSVHKHIVMKQYGKDEVIFFNHKRYGEDTMLVPLDIYKNLWYNDDD